MQFNRKSLLQALKLVGQVATKNTVLPILSCVVMTDKTLRGTNLQTTIEVDISSIPDLDASFTPVAIEYKKLLETVSAIPDGVLSISSNGETVLISAGKFSVSLIGEKASDYPNPKHEEGAEVRLPFSEFIGLATSMPKFVIDPDGATLRPQLGGVCFDGSAFCATDAQIMLERRVKSPVETSQIIFPTEVIRAAVTTFGAVKDEDEVVINGNRIESPVATILFTAIAAKFPNYQQLLPQDYSEMRSFVINKETALQAISVARIGASELDFTGAIQMPEGDDKAVKISAKDTMLHREASAEFGEITGDAGEPLTIGVNLRYLSTVIEAIPDDLITVYYSAISKPFFFTSDNLNGVALLNPTLILA